MVGRWMRAIDWLLAVFLMLLFPAASIHVKMRDRYFEACAGRVREYGEMLQKQGYLSEEVLEGLLLQGDGPLTDLTLTIWQERGGERKLLDALSFSEGAREYMGMQVYPFSDGDGLLLMLRLPADGFERAYFYFCGGAPERTYTCFFLVRDGLKERMGEGKGEVDEALSLLDIFYGPVSGDRVHAVRAGEDRGLQGAGETEGGKGSRFGGGRGGRLSCDL